MPTKQKKSTAKKSASVKKAAPAVKPIVAEPAKKEEINKNVCEISTFFHALIVLIVVLLYAEIALLGVLYFNYDIRIESKEFVIARQQNIYKPKLQQTVQPEEVQ